MDETKIPVLIVGAGNLARDIADLMLDTPQYDVVGFLVNQPPYRSGSTLLGKPIVWIDDLKEFDSSVKAVCAISSMQRQQIIEQVQGFGIEFISFIHPSSRISRSASLGEGVVINSGVQVAVDAALGDFVYVNRGCLVGHDVQVGDYAVLSPGVNIAGNTTIGARTFIGMSAVIADKVKIGERCIVCAGAVVIRDVEDQQKVLGVPARVVE